ncbi:MAG: helix-turn-helix domain-containing protein, partial [Clostridium sp.]|nr:helix-turn-helix domain-containing protein [Clostridium sp.]
MTWSDIINLLMGMWDIKQEEIASRLGVDASTISRLKNGKQKTIRWKIVEIYDKLFNPFNSGSLAYSENTNSVNTDSDTDSDTAVEKSLLNQLKQTLQDLKLGEVVTQINSDEYECFVKEMIKLAQKANPPVSSKQTEPILKYEEQVHQDETSPEEMHRNFYQSCKDYGIENFIEADSSASLLPYQIEDAIHFIGHITNKLKKQGCPYEDN